MKWLIELHCALPFLLAREELSPTWLWLSVDVNVLVENCFEYFVTATANPSLTELKL